VRGLFELPSTSGLVVLHKSLALLALPCGGEPGLFD